MPLLSVPGFICFQDLIDYWYVWTQNWMFFGLT